MVRKLIPLAVAIVLVLGCKKKPSTEPDPPSGTPNAPAAPGATYTIKIREEAKGDKSVVVKTENTTITPGAGKGGPGKVVGRYEYTEEILEMPAGAPRPTRLTRTYKTAEKTEGGKAEAFSFVGKTVTIAKGAGDQYTATVGARPLAGAELSAVLEGLDKPAGPPTAELMPRGAVKLNEGWTVDTAVLKRLAESSGIPADAAKSTLTGKLTKVYSKDGQQWGVIEMRLQASGTVTPPPGKGETSDLSLVMDASYETPIDGSAHAGIKTTKGKVTITPRGGGGAVVIEGDETETRTPAK